jgi:stress-induced morphogen
MLKLMQKKAGDLLVEDGNGVSSLTSVNSGLNSEVGAEKNSTLGSRIEASNVGLSSDENAGGTSEKNSTLGSKIDGGIEGLNLETSSNDNVKELELVGSVSNEAESNSDDLGGRGKRIKEALQRELSPIELQVEDISYQHAGHAGVRGSGDGETHFNVKVVSNEFEGKSLIKRHRLIYDLLQEELQSGLHALSIVAKTPSEVSGR